ncbi:HD family phosphohydrolase [Bacillus sp. 03113]|uniref:HD family phosphohydrolase n=1 Tax=Bacillus sp. 03113 TaxID=2578211 RepID=UPI0011436DA8|nr:HD family phosphohydrolase [Bacillus sp. 03113]
MKTIRQQLLTIKGLLDIPFFNILFFLFLGVLLFASMVSDVKPEKLNLSLFSIAEQTIRSPITVEDTSSTSKKKKEAEDQVKDVYVLNKEIAQNRVDLITSIFESAVEVNDEISKDLDQKRKAAAENKDSQTNVAEITEPSLDEKLKKMKEKLTDNVTKEISDQSLRSLLLSSQSDVNIAKDTTVTAINNVMSVRIPGDEVENAKKRLEEVLRYTSLSSGLKSASIELGRYAIIQNEFYDPNQTEDLRREAIQGVEPVKILQGQIIVEQGQLISREIYRQLGLAGLLNNENSIQPFLGLSLIILIFLATLYYYFQDLNLKPQAKQNQLLLFSLLFLLALCIMKATSFIQFNYTEIGYIFPAAMAAMLIKILMDERLAIFVTIILAVCGSIIYNEGTTGSLHISMGIYILCSGLAGILFLNKQNRRSKILQAGLFVTFINIVVIFSFIFLRNGKFDILEYGFHFGIALISGVASAVLTIGLLPFFEAGFGILSTMKLIELSNPNHPLLRKILTEAPGTYHHSVMVANLAESACEGIGANGLLARVACYYHDIGKTKRPQFFIENQLNIDNPHDRLSPQVSKNIIIAHATDGAEMLKKHHMPKEIIDVAEQHHGTSLIKFFYHKAKQNGGEVSEEDYRYPGPKAQTKEAAIIGIADSVEAAVRSMSHPTAEQIEKLVKNIITDRLQDGQLNECDLTLKDLEKVTHSFCETLKGIFHSRIEYPEMNKQKVKQA